ncbi:MAG: flagellar hook-length control protein FliK [Nitrospirae bacterium]|nr:flagellar hook-length control protein FliK [Nitrospirota bacterium]
MQVPLIINADNVLTLLKPFGKGLNLRINDIVKAEILNVMDSGDVSLRVLGENGESSIIVAKSDIPLTKGMTVQFRVTASDAEIKLQFMGTASEGNKMVERTGEELLPQKALRILSEFAGSKLKQDELKLMEEVFKTLPEKIKTAFPEFRAIERILPEIDKLSSGLLKKSVEDSGILFETKLKLAVQEEVLDGTGERLKDLLGGGDHKMELFRLREALQHTELTGALQRAGIKPSEVAGMVDKLIRNVEFFQLTSQVNDAIYTFLPLAWQELKEGELSFKRGRDNRGESYTCDINLDLEPAGKLSVAVTLFENSFYLSFYAADQRLKELISEGRGLLEQRFHEAGLPLKVVNIGQKQEIGFGTTKTQGLNIKV